MKRRKKEKPLAPNFRKVILPHCCFTCIYYNIDYDACESCDLFEGEVTVNTLCDSYEPQGK